MAVNGEGGQTLLDSYHAERHPVAEKVIEFSSNLTKAGTVRGGARVVIRPGGYIGAVTELDDHNSVADYFARVAR